MKYSKERADFRVAAGNVFLSPRPCGVTAPSSLISEDEAIHERWTSLQNEISKSKVLAIDADVLARDMIDPVYECAIQASNDEDSIAMYQKAFAEETKQLDMAEAAFKKILKLLGT